MSSSKTFTGKFGLIRFPPKNIQRRRLTSEDHAIGNYHQQLKKFFNDETSFSRQFQQIYQILNEHDRVLYPAMVVTIFCYLKHYKHAVKEDNRIDIKKLLRKYTRSVNRLEVDPWPRFITEADIVKAIRCPRPFDQRS